MIDIYFKDNEGIWFIWPVIAVDKGYDYIGISIAWLNWQLSAEYARR